jgi:hypothetical protein
LWQHTSRFLHGGTCRYCTGNGQLPVKEQSFGLWFRPEYEPSAWHRAEAVRTHKPGWGKVQKPIAKGTCLRDLRPVI